MSIEAWGNMVLALNFMVVAWVGYFFWMAWRTLIRIETLLIRQEAALMAASENRKNRQIPGAGVDTVSVRALDGSRARPPHKKRRGK